MTEVKTDKHFDILPPKNQLRLFGYNKHFEDFIKLFKIGKLPNKILLSGNKGCGKATFSYHFINYLLTYGKTNKYIINDFAIDKENFDYKNLCNNTNPNFFLLENTSSEESIKIESTRKLIKFLNKTTYSSDIKIVLIDNAEQLNIHSSNALLKVLEESNERTFFFIIYNNSNKILSTIKSRCTEFKIHFSTPKKKTILKKLASEYIENFDINKIDDNLLFDTPGNILKYLIILTSNNIDILNDKTSCILYLMDKYNQKKDPELFSFLSILIELYYNDLFANNQNNLELYSMQKYKLLNLINDTKKFNLDKKNLFITIKETISNESR